MNGARTQSNQRIVGIAGILFVVLYAGPGLLWGGVRPDEAPAKVASELVSHNRVLSSMPSARVVPANVFSLVARMADPQARKVGVRVRRTACVQSG